MQHDASNTNELDTLRPILETIAPDALREPSMPMAVALQEAHDLQVTLDTGDTWERLLEVGVEAASIAGLAPAVEAARQAQSQWVVIRDRAKPQAQHEREEEGRRLRSDLLATCRWNLRGDERARTVMSYVVEGEGVPDLVQDLRDMAELVERHIDRFDDDATFDAAAQAEAARSLAEEIAAGLSYVRQPVEQQDAKLLRDRAYTHLAGLVAELREAGRYAFRDDPQRVEAFASEHLRRRRKRRARQDREAEELAPSPVTPAAQ